ncbi:M1 family metallopeptidase [Catenuloplanes nepalensis]|uniref:M1 family metallopeptidase n=1 Tax=Catenuloplanes nepalensis TaxID=587533 RepID=UPI00351FCE5B
MKSLRRSVRKSTAAVLTAGLLATACTSPLRTPSISPSGAEGAGGIGAEGIGDPYFPRYGNGGYDVGHYGIQVRYDPATDQLTGRVAITAVAAVPLRRFNLDFTGLPTTRITVNGQPATAEQQESELRVTPAAEVSGDFTVEIDYAGVPQPIKAILGEGGWLHTEDGAIALGQPESASSWFPVNDHPLDKATYDLAITVPEGLSALSNGTPEGTTTADGWTTWRWAERAPMAPYLTTLVIGDYRITSGSHRNRPILTAVAKSFPEGGDADAAMARTAEVADFLETQFGPYPFESYGGVVVADPRISYALETQSRPVYGPSFFRAGSDSSWVVAHELAHQWFGDSVSIGGWQHIWLNEGFASYAEWLWAEKDRKISVQSQFDDVYGLMDWTVPTGDPGPANIFSGAVYRRGALAVHALRLTVGDDAFFKILKAWTTERRNGNAVTADFIALSERVSGKSLRPLFDAWLFGTAQPPVPKP